MRFANVTILMTKKSSNLIDQGNYGKKLENKDFPSMGLNIQLYNLGYFRQTND